MTIRSPWLRKAASITAAASLAAVSLAVAATPASAQEPDGTITGVTSPQGLAVNPVGAGLGNLYVAGSRGSTVSVVEPGHTSPTPSMEITGLNHPRAVAFDSTGLLYIANAFASNVLVYDVSTPTSPSLVRTLTGVSTPFGVAVDSTGTVFASSGLDTTVMVFDAGATTPNPAKTLTGLTKANAVAVDRNDNIYVSNQGGSTVQVFDSGATTPDDSRTLTGLNNPQGVAVNSAGRVYVANGYGANALVYNPKQTTADPALTLTGSVAPQGVAINDSDTVYLGNSDTGADNILVYNPPTPPSPTFTCTGAPEDYQVPDWATHVTIKLKGAQGGGQAGGHGGTTTSTVAVTPGSTLQVNVGCTPAGGSPQTGGFNGGANAGQAGGSSGNHLGAYNGGGGASDIRIGDCAATLNCPATARVVVAGGGGGGEVRGSKSHSGGAGGAPTAGDGTNDSWIGVGGPGKGGSATAGGAGGNAAAFSHGTKGSAGTEGSGGMGGSSASTAPSGPGAGGGGGLFGGGGGGAGDHATGSGIGGAGGGGSSGIGPAGTAIASNTSYSNGSVTGDGSVTITPVQTPLTVTTTSLADGTETVAYSQQLQASGGVTPYTWALATGSSLAGTGLTLAPGGELQGTPPASSSGTYNFTVEVSDDDGHTATKPLSLTIDTGIAITTSSLPDGSESVAYSQTLTSSGGGGATGWAIDSGALPPGLALNSTTGEISGTPTVADTFNFVVEVTGVDASTALAPLSITIAEPLSVTTSSPLAEGALGSSYSLQLSSAGGIGPNTWSSSGSLPGGLSVNSAGLLSGTPTDTGTFTFTAEVTDSLTTTATKDLTFTINSALTVTTTSVPNGTVSTAYSQQLATSGGVGPDAWAVTSGELPTGLSLEQHSGEIVGTPTAAGSFNFTVTATDSLSATASQPLSITVGTTPTPT
ncbi:MAG TPA: hypothetical protein DCQ04_12170, partial [Actinobacteria bacterium]|nr:hypothetical protein [Actinomycetota bacterium]